ncbi:MAG TPA: hypothetical protein VM101_14505 [Flavitalea sp.]|nr:hypothetical protein [Flavitalea sp.]
MKYLFLIFIVSLNSFFTYSQEGKSTGVVEDNSELSPGESVDEKIKKNFFLKADVSKTECYVGEPLMAVFKAYSRLDANSQVLKRPSLSGFSVIEMVDAYNTHPEIERLNGVNYFVHLIRKVQLFPLQPGSFTIEPAEVESIIHLRKSRSKSISNIRDIFRRGNNVTIEKQIVFQTPQVNIKVIPLPEKDQPDDYEGAVGDFMVHLQMAETSVAAREPAIVKLIISGTGNIPLVTEPHVSWPASAEISGPGVTEQVNKYVYPLSGVKTYQFTIEHRDTGKFVIPPVRLSFFHPTSKTYKIAESKELSYTVSGVRGTQKKDVQMVFKNEKQAPLHYYYFAGIALVIISLIIYFMLKPLKDKI